MHIVKNLFLKTLFCYRRVGIEGTILIVKENSETCCDSRNIAYREIELIRNCSYISC